MRGFSSATAHGSLRIGRRIHDRRMCRTRSSVRFGRISQGSSHVDHSSRRPFGVVLGRDGWTAARPRLLSAHADPTLVIRDAPRSCSPPEANNHADGAPARAHRLTRTDHAGCRPGRRGHPTPRAHEHPRRRSRSAPSRPTARFPLARAAARPLARLERGVGVALGGGHDRSLHESSTAQRSDPDRRARRLASRRLRDDVARCMCFLADRSRRPSNSASR